jgi:hypothetical protein
MKNNLIMDLSHQMASRDPLNLAGYAHPWSESGDEEGGRGEMGIKKEEAYY